MDHFAYPVPGTDKVISLAPFDSLPAGVYRRARNDNEIGMTFSLIEAAATPTDLAVIDEMTLPALNEMFLAWSEAVGADLPQS